MLSTKEVREPLGGPNSDYTSIIEWGGSQHHFQWLIWLQLTPSEPVLVQSMDDDEYTQANTVSTSSGIFKLAPALSSIWTIFMFWRWQALSIAVLPSYNTDGENQPLTDLIQTSVYTYTLSWRLVKAPLSKSNVTNSSHPPAAAAVSGWMRAFSGENSIFMITT